MTFSVEPSGGSDLPPFLNRWPGIEAAARSRQWPRIVHLAEQVVAAPELAGLLLLGSFAQGEADSLSDVDFIVVVEPGRFDEAWEKRHDLHPEGAAACWDYPRPDNREVAAHRWLTPELVLFDGLIATLSGTRVADPLVVLVGEVGLADRMTRFDPAEPGGEIELNEVERLYGQLKLAARAAREM